MAGNLIEETEDAVAGAVAATLVAAWLLSCRSSERVTDREIIDLAMKWTENDGPVAQTLHTPSFGRWVCSHVDRLVKATTRRPSPF